MYGNADAAIYRSEPDAIRRTLAEHPAAPVRFLDQIEAMYADGVRTFIEVGAGSALTGLIDAILGDRDHMAVSLDKRGRDGVTAWHEAVGRLAAHGVPMDLDQAVAGLGSRLQRSRAARGPASNVGAHRRNGLHPALRAEADAKRCQRLPRVSFPHRLFWSPPPPWPSPPPAAPRAEPVPSAHWLAAAQEMQRQTAEAHMHFQRVLADSHQAFLQMAENTFAAFTGQPPPLAQQVPALVPMSPAPEARAAPVPEPPVPQQHLSRAIPTRAIAG